MSLPISRRTAGAALLALAAAPAWPESPAPGTTKILRYAFPVAETGFDPVKLSDLYSRTVTRHIFESLYGYDHLARPTQIRPLTTTAMPEMADEYRTWTFRIRPGIFFADDPAFKGQRRELVAADYVFTLKRFADPATKSPVWSSIEEMAFVGLKELRAESLKSRTPFDYDLEIPGLRAIDRHTLQFRLETPRPRMHEDMADASIYGAVAREVVQAYGEQIAAHPVGTGPFRLKSWRRSSRIVLERNPGYRERFYEDEAAPDAADAEGQALLARFKGRRLPLVDQVEISIIEEPQPRWLSFLNEQADFCERVPEEFISSAMPAGKVAPNLARRGIRGMSVVGPEGTLTVYNMEHPVVGGYTPEKVALRRAINLAVDVPREIVTVRRSQAIPAQSPCVPHTTGYDPNYKSEMGDHDPARSMALLDIFGYVDRDGDGFRELPNGEPLLIVRRTHSDGLQRQLDALWQKNLKAIGLKVEFQVAQWPENLKAAQAGNFMVWAVGSSASQPDGIGSLQRLYGPSSGGANLSRFRNAEFDALYDHMRRIPDGPERDRLFLQAKRMSVAWAPYRQHVHRIYNDMMHPWLIGYRRPFFSNRWWHLVDIDGAPRGRQST
ncbi:MAG: ABC transporter substrate-binding protein [Caldimonas sp.]